MDDKKVIDTPQRISIDSPREPYEFIKLALEQRMSWAIDRQTVIFTSLQDGYKKETFYNLEEMYAFVEAGYGSGWRQIIQEYIEKENPEWAKFEKNIDS